MIKKIFKDYKQYTLVILSALLMVAFIVPQANTFVGGTPEKRKVATLHPSKSRRLSQKMQKDPNSGTLFYNFYLFCPFLLSTFFKM